METVLAFKSWRKMKKLRKHYYDNDVNGEDDDDDDEKDGVGGRHLEKGSALRHIKVVQFMAVARDLPS